VSHKPWSVHEQGISKEITVFISETPTIVTPDSSESGSSDESTKAVEPKAESEEEPVTRRNLIPTEVFEDGE